MEDKVNIIMLAFFKTGNGNPRALSFGNLFDVIRANDIDGKPILPAIQLVAFLNIIGAGSEKPSRMEAGDAPAGERLHFGKPAGGRRSGADGPGFVPAGLCYLWDGVPLHQLHACFRYPFFSPGARLWEVSISYLRRMAGGGKRAGGKPGGGCRIRIYGTEKIKKEAILWNFSEPTTSQSK